MLDRAEVVPVLSAVHDTLALRRPGGITRISGWWEVYADRHADDALLAAVHTDQDGTDDGFAVAVARGRPDRSGRTAAGTRCTSRTCTPATSPPRPACGGSCSAST